MGCTHLGSIWEHTTSLCMDYNRMKDQYKRMKQTICVLNTQKFFQFFCFDRMPSTFSQEDNDLWTKLFLRSKGKAWALGWKFKGNLGNNQRSSPCHKKHVINGWCGIRWTSNNKHDWIPIKYLNVLHYNKIFWVIWTCLATSIKKDNANLEKLLNLSACKK